MMTRFLRTWSLCVAVFAAGVLCLTIGVDPYGMLGTPRIEGWTAQKAAAADWERLSKPYMVEAVQPATLLLGSSYIAVGLDPVSPAWPATAHPVFNLAIAGANPLLLLRTLAHALNTTRPKLVLMGVSFEDSLTYPLEPGRRRPDDMNSPAALEARFRVDENGKANPRYFLARLKDFVFATVSLKAVRDSIRTLFTQGDRYENYQTPLGQNTGGKFASWIAREGQHALIMDKDRQKAPAFVRWVRHPMTNIKPVAAAIRMAQSHGAEVIVFIVPSHVDELELFRQIGMTADYQAWKAALAALVEASAAPGTTVPLWDFGNYSPYTTEQVPPPSDTTTTLRWIWEPIHFRSELGTLMVERMMRGTGPEELGVRIASGDVPGRAVAYEEAQRAWVASHPGDVARLQEVVATAVEAICHTTLKACVEAGRSTASR